MKNKFVKDTLDSFQDIYSGARKTTAQKAADDAERAYKTFHKKVKDAPIYEDTLKELAADAAQKKKTAKSVSRMTSAAQASPYVGAGTAGAVIGAEMHDKFAADFFQKYGLFKEAMPRAWKRNFSENIRDALESAGILDHAKESAGLRTGSRRIAEQLGVPITHYNALQVGKKAVSGVYDAPGKVEALKLDDKNRKLFQRLTALQSMGSGNFVTAFHEMNSPHTFINEGNSKNIAKLSAKMFTDGQPKLSKIDHDYIHNLFLRHEVDEARAAQYAFNKKTLHTVGPKSGGKVVLTGTTTGHMGPSVLLRESTHVATAPRAAKETMVGLRKKLGDSAVLKNLGDYEYAKPGKFDARVAKHMEDEIVKANKPAIEDALRQD